jgi:hypothetical protein
MLNYFRYFYYNFCVLKNKNDSFDDNDIENNQEIGKKRDIEIMRKEYSVMVNIER